MQRLTAVTYLESISLVIFSVCKISSFWPIFSFKINAFSRFEPATFIPNYIFCLNFARKTFFLIFRRTTIYFSTFFRFANLNQAYTVKYVQHESYKWHHIWIFIEFRSFATFIFYPISGMKFGLNSCVTESMSRCHHVIATRLIAKWSH